MGRGAAVQVIQGQGTQGIRAGGIKPLPQGTAQQQLNISR